MSKFRGLEVCQTVDRRDYMYRLLSKANQPEYFHQAAETLALMEKLGDVAGRPFAKGNTILDYGCGYGRITRYFAAYLGARNVVGCDVNPGAVDFCRTTLDVDAVVVTEPFDEVDFGRKFDWIFAGSVFTHVNAEYWRQILDLFERSLAPNGYILLTTAGENVAQLVQSGAFDDIAKGAARAMVASHQYSGFGYAQYKHAEENNSNLGRCVVQPRWVFDFVERFKELKLQFYLKQGWCGRQDVYLLSASP